jgi:hypothetical protein
MSFKQPIENSVQMLSRHGQAVNTMARYHAASGCVPRKLSLMPHREHQATTS